MQLSRQLGAVLQALGNRSVSRGAAEAALDDLVATFSLRGPLPSFRVADWKLAAAIFLRALSHHQLPSSQPCFSYDTNCAALHRLLATGLDSNPEEFDLLHELVYPF